MASPVLPSSAPTTISSSSIQTSFFPKTSQLSTNRKIKNRKVVSFKAMKNENQSPENKGESSSDRFDRRDVLLGLGGLYGATNLGHDPFAFAAPIAASDTTRCGGANKEGNAPGQALAAETKNKQVIRNIFPIVLDKPVSVEVPRPRKSRSKREKEEEEEVLVLESILLPTDATVKIDIYVNDEDDQAPSGPEHSEFVGSYTNIPHGISQGKKLQTNFSVGLSEVLEDLDVEGDENIVVSLVPKQGKGLVTVGNIKIDYIRE